MSNVEDTEEVGSLRCRAKCHHLRQAAKVRDVRELVAARSCSDWGSQRRD